VEQGQQKLFEEYRYFFPHHQRPRSTDEQIVFSANDRCDQPALSEAEGENLIEQLKNGVGSMRTRKPLAIDDLESARVWCQSRGIVLEIRSGDAPRWRVWLNCNWGHARSDDLMAR